MHLEQTTKALNADSKNLLSEEESGDPDYCIVNIGQNTEKSSGDLKELAVTQTPVKGHQLMSLWKNRKGGNNNNLLQDLLSHVSGPAPAPGKFAHTNTLQSVNLIEFFIYLGSKFSSLLCSAAERQSRPTILIHFKDMSIYLGLFFAKRLGHFVHCTVNGPGDLGSIPGRVIPKTLKMVLDTSLLNTQHYKVRIKDKVDESREKSSALPYTSV